MSFLLHASPRSPFARRIRLALDRLELPYTIELIDPFQPSTEFLHHNPLGLVPSLTTPENECLFDSHLILEHLHDRTQKIWPDSFQARTKMRLLSQTATGIMTQAVSLVVELNHREVPSPRWSQDAIETIQRSLKWLIQAGPFNSDQFSELSSLLWIDSQGIPTQAGFDLACALEYLDFRVPHIKASEKTPGFTALLQYCTQFDFFKKSRPQ